MGFKRTTEGRVFFQGANTNDAPARSREEQAEIQNEIVGLLKALSEKLHATQAERDEIRAELAAQRSKVEQLSQKTGYDQEEITDRFHRFEELGKRQATLEKMQLEQQQKLANHSAHAMKISRRLEETEEKQDALIVRMEDTATEQARLVRQIDKAVQDRSRMLRKMERIEETVLQTRDAINAGAFRMLPNQTGTQDNLAAGNGSERLTALLGPDPFLHSGNDKDYNPGTGRAGKRWQNGVAQKTFGVTALLLGGVLLGWAINSAQMPKMPKFESGVFESLALDEGKWEPVVPQEEAAQSESVEESALNVTPPVEGVEEDFSAITEVSPQEPQEMTEDIAEGEIVSESTAEETTVQPNSDDVLANDIGAIDLKDEASLLAALEKNPEALAARLNEIEPTSLPENNEVTPSAEEKTVEQRASPMNSPLAALMPVDAALPKVIKDIERQAYDGNAEAQHDLAAIYTAGHGGVTQDYKRAAFWFEQAAKGGVANARYNLGVLYHQGIGVNRDLEKALDWYKEAAELNHPEAQYNLGIAYIEGIGLEYDPDKAARYFENAADAGVMEAAYNLGLIYENGLLGKARPDEALMWYKRAADKGSPEAQAALNQLAKSLDMKIGDVNALVEKVERRQAGRNDDAQPEAVEYDANPAARSGKSSYVTPLDAEQQARRAMTAQAQQYLMDAGLYPGPADGMNGPLTQDAVRAYQIENDLGASGDVSEELLTHMRSRNAAEQGSRAQ